MPKVVHFELPVDDPSRAQQFYRDAFGWSFEGWESADDYWLTAAGGQDEVGVGGALINRSDLHKSPVVILGVVSVDDALKAAEDAGGQIVHGKHTIPGVGYSGYVRDTEGNVVGVFESDESATG